jgi:arsenite methyltransferase
VLRGDLRRRAGQLHPGGAALTRRTAALAGLERGERVLDAASGRGDSALLLAAELGVEVVGVESGATAVASAREGARARRSR